MMAEFDNVARFYDRLAHIVFGITLLKSKLHFLNQIQSGDKVLIIGGGTGEILPFLPERCRITFMDPSVKMIEIARKREQLAQTEFVAQTLAAFENSSKFDVIITNFFFDLFEEPELSQQIEKIKSLLEVNGKLIVNDFCYSSALNQFWQRPLVATMYLFFRITTRLTTSSLPAIPKKLELAGFKLQDKRLWAMGFVWGGVFESSIINDDLKP